MRQVRLLSLLIVVLAALVIVPVASAKNADLVTPSCADGCPPGPRPTMY
ncbi:MAG TPA: hypothetical protein VD973_17055 [Symbiobacteriaceae bacterium]|nr:hypothetical protein [Symbiobacteriaceae bacterium]